MYCDERVIRFPVQWRGNRYFSLATLLTAANKKVGELYQEYQMQIAPLPNGNLVFEYGTTDPAISIKEFTLMETLLLNYTACYEALNPYVARRRTVHGIQTLILKPESEILASQGQEAHYHYIKTVAAVSLAALIIQDPFFFIPDGFLGSLGFDVDIFVPYLKMPAWITETVVSFQFQAGHNWLLNLKSYEEIMGRVRTGYFHKPSSRRINPLELVSTGKRQALSQEENQSKRPKGTEIQKSHVFANFQMEVLPTEASASVPKMEVDHTEASPSVSRVVEKKETEEEKETICLP